LPNAIASSFVTGWGSRVIVADDKAAPEPLEFMCKRGFKLLTDSSPGTTPLGHQLVHQGRCSNGIKIHATETRPPPGSPPRPARARRLPTGRSARRRRLPQTTAPGNRSSIGTTPCHAGRRPAPQAHRPSDEQRVQRERRDEKDGAHGPTEKNTRQRANNRTEYNSMCLAVSSRPCTTGIIGTRAAAYSFS
jgi:hypothetical protein